MNIDIWSAVFAADISVINEILEDHRKHQDVRLDIDISDVRITGVFGAFRIVPGGAGDFVDIETPILSGSMQLEDGAAIPIDGARPVGRIALRLLPAEGDASRIELRFDLRAPTSGDSAAQELGAIRPIRVDDAPAALSAFQTQLLGLAVAKALAAHADALALVLAQVAADATAQSAWLTPKRHAFAYLEPEGRATGVLAIFLSEDPALDPHDAAMQISPELLPNGARIAMAAAPELFLRHIVAPALATTFNVAPLSFALDDVAQSWARHRALVDQLNRSGANVPQLPRPQPTLRALHPLAMGTVKEGIIYYHPLLRSVTATVEDDRIAMTAKGHCDMYMNIDLSFSAKAELTVAFEPREGAVALESAADLHFVKHLDIPWYDHVALALGGGVTGEAALLIVANLIADGLGRSLDQIGHHQTRRLGMARMVEFGAGGRFHPSEAGLSGCFYLRSR